MMENGESDRRLSDPPDTDESDGCQAFGPADNLLNQLATSEAGPWCGGRQFAECARCECKILNPPVVWVTDLV